MLISRPSDQALHQKTNENGQIMIITAPAPADVKDQLRRVLGVTDAHLTAYGHDATWLAVNGQDRYDGTCRWCSGVVSVRPDGRGVPRARADEKMLDPGTADYAECRGRSRSGRLQRKENSGDGTDS
jgi:hypothetical protein